MFTFHERLGIFCAIEAAGLSVLGTSLILCYAIVNWICIRLSSCRGRQSPKPASAADSSLFLNLMFADLLQGLGIFPSIRWMNDGFITTGTSDCEAQATLKELGINGVALSSLVIGLHTFAILVLGWRLPRYAGLVACCVIWVFTALVVGVNRAVHRSDDYFVDTGYWCWVNEEFRISQLTSEYLWMWSSAALMLILYGMMFLAMKGIVTVPNLGGFRPKVLATWRSRSNIFSYPAVYIVCVLPNSVSRWMSFNGRYVNPGYALFASALFSLSGFLNALLFMLTRPKLVWKPKVDAEGRPPSIYVYRNETSQGDWISRTRGIDYILNIEK
ncbi:hypothetical protein BDQ17DRAFT_1421071 [Cyathus striatus]|nr:hypothetical protein BDQ17DRAFT_1421071 [Cyathus striatus]